MVGIDASPDMIVQARMRLPQVEFLVMDACDMPWNGCVDALFSNAALHWIEDQERLTAAGARQRPGGLLVCEFWRAGQYRAYPRCLWGGLSGRAGRGRHWPGASELRAFLFSLGAGKPSAGLLSRHGFSVRLAEEYDRPTLNQ